MEKKELRLRKGTQVRVLRTGAIGKIEEIVLIRKNARVHRYCCLQMVGSRRKEWYDSSEFAKVKEDVTVAIEVGEKRAELRFSADYKRKSLLFMGQTSAGYDLASLDKLKWDIHPRLENLLFGKN